MSFTHAPPTQVVQHRLHFALVESHRLFNCTSLAQPHHGSAHHSPLHPPSSFHTPASPDARSPHPSQFVSVLSDPSCTYWQTWGQYPCRTCVRIRDFFTVQTRDIHGER
jgi:hypothetical protein